MALCGYAGRILYINLTSGAIRVEPLNEALVHKYIGGWGINHRLYYDLVPPGVQPFSPENPFIIGTGPFIGTIVPASSRTYITYKHPLSGTIGSAVGSGMFSYMLKSAGYDHVVITGKAAKPVCLKITESGAQLCDAGALRGKDTYDTVFALRREYEPCGVIATGQAGENRVNISVTHLDSGQGALGQGGMPAVMGDKNLKAIVAVQGSQSVSVAYPKRLVKAVDQVLAHIATYPRLPGLREGGGWYMLRGGMMGGGLGQDTREDSANEARAFEEHKRSRHSVACPCCPVACRERIDLAEGDYAGLTSYHSMTFGEGLNLLGVRLNYGQLVKYNDTMNRYGLDTQFFSDTLGLLLNLYESGRITQKALGGLPLERTYESFLKIAAMVAYRDGFGDTIANGIRDVCRKLGLDPEKDVIHIKGWNRVGDPRIGGMSTGFGGFSQLIDPRGPTGSCGSTSPPSYQANESLERWLKYAREQGLPAEAEARIFTADSFNPARLSKWMNSYFSVLQSLGFCGRLYITRFHGLATMAEYYAALTGIDMTPDELLHIGERNWNMLKILNRREGFSRQDDCPPAAWFKPLKVPNSGNELRLMDYYKRRELKRQDVERLLDDYYDESGWDSSSTAPRPAKLKELDLADMTF